MTDDIILAIAVRRRIAAVALVQHGRVLAVHRRHFAFTPEGTTRASHLAGLIRRLVSADGTTTVVVEPRSTAEAAVLELGLEPHPFDVAAAQRILTGDDRSTRRVFFGRLLAEHPELTGYVRVLPTGQIAMTERWRTVNLLAAALGLAYARHARSQHNLLFTMFPTNYVATTSKTV